MDKNNKHSKGKKGQGLDEVEEKADRQDAKNDLSAKGSSTLATRSSARAKAEARIPNMPKIVTKDTNDIDELPLEISMAPHDYEDIKYSDGEIVFDRSYSMHTKSIDESMLSVRKSNIKLKGKQLNTDISKATRFTPEHKFGLTFDQVNQRYAEGYVNYTTTKTGKTYTRIFVDNIFTFFNFLTFIVAIALIVAQAEISQLFFMFIIVANITIGIYQEVKAKRTVDKLSLITAPSAIVIRNGEKLAIPVKDVVLDDILYLEAGKQICADAVVVKGEIEVNEAMLTGESVPVKKGEKVDLFSGSFVTSGNCYARVEKVGAANYVETLTSQVKKFRKPKSELYGSVRLLMRVISFIIVPLATATFLTHFLGEKGGWDNINTIIKQTSGAIIGMMPAGMFLLTTTALFVSVRRLGKRRILVQDLYCIEMLARVDVLCFDKTGTITDGTMQVNEVIKINNGDSEFSINDIIGSMLTATGDNNQTSMALANHFGYSQKLVASKVLPFSSQRKFSAVSFEDEGTYMLGAPEYVLKDIGIRIEKTIKEHASNGFRVLALAHSAAPIVKDKLPASRKAICLIIVEDHIREDAAATIDWFKNNNVQVKVISGDNPITVSEVARRVGVEKAELYISLDGLSDHEVIEAANKYTVFGRVTPEQKCLLVKALKSKGHTVAMTGDGVNDILAMREADCSISIATGAEAAMNVSHLVLLDSSFTSMPEVVMEGRRVINNIQQSSSLFLMKTIMSMVLSVIFLFMRELYPFKTNMVLLLEFAIIGLPSFVLAFQKNTKLIKGKFLSNVIGRSFPGGIVLVAVTMLIYFYCTNILKLESGDPVYLTMLVLGITFAGFMILAKTCEPFDAFKTILLFIVLSILAIGIFFFPESFFDIYKETLKMQDILYIIVLVFGSYFAISGLIVLMRRMKIIA